MKKSAKHIDITNWETVLPWVQDCMFRHYKRNDFKRLLISHGLSEVEYLSVLNDRKYHDKTPFLPAIESIAKYACECIRARKLDMPPIKYRKKMEICGGVPKERLIGNESAIQQVYDYIAVHSSMDVFKRFIVLQQMSSMPKKGQEKGMRMIRSWILSDIKAKKYSDQHGYRYTKKNLYFVKRDVHQCYPSSDMEVFLALFSKYCGNDTIIWLWRELLTSHRVDGYTGMMIGALTSSWAVQFMLSFVWRYAMSLYHTRRGKKVKIINNGLFFMDDQLYTSSSRAKLVKAMAMLDKFTWDKLHYRLKENWQIHCIDDAPIDMMGYVIHGNGKVTIRGKNYVHIRRNFLRFNSSSHYSLRQARRACSFKGKVKHTNNRKIIALYGVTKAVRVAASVVSEHDRRKAGTLNV